MTRSNPAVYPGTYVTCVYDHTKAMCRPDDQPPAHHADLHVRSRAAVSRWIAATSH